MFLVLVIYVNRSNAFSVADNLFVANAPKTSLLKEASHGPSSTIRAAVGGTSPRTGVVIECPYRDHR
jgi:hypothetical protein